MVKVGQGKEVDRLSEGRLKVLRELIRHFAEIIGDLYTLDDVYPRVCAEAYLVK